MRRSYVKTTRMIGRCVVATLALAIAMMSRDVHDGAGVPVASAERGSVLQQPSRF